jgi:hypothetical protein
MKRLSKHILKPIHLLTMLLIIAGSSSLSAQQIMIDRGVKAGDLWCFPLLTDSLVYLYLPSDARLGTDNNGQPQFSFLRYVDNKKDSTAGNNSISKAGGGAVLNFLVMYETPQKKVNEAKTKLKEILQVDDITLRGPLIFSEGRYALISSIINSSGKEETKLLATGNAPVLENSRIALSFELDPKASKTLMESFQMATPDISIVFDMGFSGITDAYRAELVVNWDDVKKAEMMKASASVYFVSADVEKSVLELKRNNAIQLTTIGENAHMDALLTTVYGRLVDLLFQPIDPEVAQATNGLADLIGNMLRPQGAMGSGKVFGFGLNAAYKRRDFQSTGKSVMNFNSRVTVQRHHLIAFNIGDFYKKYGNDPKYFKSVSLEDPDFQQREIFVSVDGTLLPEFDKLINNITVTLKKTHENGDVTLKEQSITKKSLNDNKVSPLIYGSISDKDRLNWLSYEYKTNFQFQGGKTYETPWTKQSAGMINVYAPYERRVVQLDGDVDALKTAKVRAITVQLDYPFFSDSRKPMLSLKPTDPMGEKKFEITLPTNVYEYNYEINWIMGDGSTKSATGKNKSGYLFIDNLPTN